MDTVETALQPKWTYHADRPSIRSDAEREEHFQAWLAKTEPYFAAIEAAGDQPWFDSVEQRRELFMRRYKPLNPTNTQETAA